MLPSYNDNSALYTAVKHSNPHGSHIANLIIQLNPYCDLYIAKVTEKKRDIDCRSSYPGEYTFLYMPLGYLLFRDVKSNRN